MPYTIPPLPTSTVYQIWYAAGQATGAIIQPIELGVGVFFAFLVIAAIVKTAGWELGPLPDYDDFEPEDTGGAFGGPELSSHVDWDELDRRASGSLEHDAML